VVALVGDEEEGDGVGGVGGVGATGEGVDEELGVAVVGGDDPVGVVLADGGVDAAELGVDGFYGADGGFELAGVADHVGVGEVDDDDVEGGVGEGADDGVGDALGGHLGGEVVGGYLLGLDDFALFAGERLLDAAVEEVGDVRILLGLGYAEVGVAEDVGEEVARAWLKDGVTFRPERLYRHNSPTRKHAYLLARFMGHGSPATTLGSYVHCLDWLLASALAQSKRMSPDESTIEMASGLTGKTHQHWIKGSDHWEVPLTFWRQRASAVKPTVITENGPADSDPVALDLSELERTWNFLMTVHRPDETAETAGAIWRVDSQLANRVLERVAVWKHSVSLCAADRERSLSATDPATALMASDGIPNLPCHEADQQVVAAWDPFMQAMYSDPSRKVGLTDALSIYMHRVWVSKGYVLFHDAVRDGDEARQFMAFIDALPIPSCNAELISFDPSERSRKRSAWRSVLQISASREIKSMRPQNSRSGASANWLAIRPNFKFDSQVLSMGPGQAGFRFALTMGFLQYGRL
jgi:hypothetical protein